MKRIALAFVLCALTAASAGATPSLGWWAEGAPGSTHQVWEFTPYIPGDGGVMPISGGWQAYPEQVVNPDPSGVVGQVNSPLGQWDGQGAFVGGFADLIVIDLKIENYPNLNTFKEIWVDLGLTNGVATASVVTPQGFRSVFLEGPGPQGEADFGFKIYPNPPWEDILITITRMPGTTGPVVLDYVHVDTICIPAPGALLLGSIGMGLIGWLKRRHSL